MNRAAGCLYCHSPFAYLFETAEDTYGFAIRYIFNIAHCISSSARNVHEAPICSLKLHPFYARVEAMMSLLRMNSMEAAETVRCWYARKAVATHNDESRTRYMNEMRCSSGLYVCRTRLSELYIEKETCLHTYMSPRVVIESEDHDPSTEIFYDGSETPFKSPCIYALRKNEGPSAFAWESNRDRLESRLQREMDRIACGGKPNLHNETYMESTIEDLWSNPVISILENEDEQEGDESVEIIDVVEPEDGAEEGPNHAAEEGPNHAAEEGPNHAADEGPNHAAVEGPNNAADEGPNHAADGGRNNAADEGRNNAADGGRYNAADQRANHAADEGANYAVGVPANNDAGVPANDDAGDLANHADNPMNHANDASNDDNNDAGNDADGEEGEEEEEEKEEEEENEEEEEEQHGSNDDGNDANNGGNDDNGGGNGANGANGGASDANNGEFDKENGGSGGNSSKESGNGRGWSDRISVIDPYHEQALKKKDGYQEKSTSMDQSLLQFYFDHEDDELEAAINQYEQARAFHLWGLQMAVENHQYVKSKQQVSRKTVNQTWYWKKAKESNKRKFVQEDDDYLLMSPTKKQERLKIDRWLAETEVKVNSMYRYRITHEGITPI